MDWFSHRSNNSPKGLCAKLSRITLFYAVTLLLALVSAGCELKIGNKKDKKGEKDIPVPVAVQPVVRADLQSFLRLNAVLEAEREVEIYSRAVGRVEFLPAEEGDRVRSGQVLAVLDEAEPQLALNRAEALLERAQHNLSQAEELFQRQMLSSDELQQIRLAHKEALISVEQARLVLSYTRITVPFNGVIAARMVDLGGRVDLARPLFKIVDARKLRINGWVSETDLRRLRIGQKVDVISTSDTSLHAQAELIRISPVIDPTYGKIKATFEISDYPPGFTAGMFIEINALVEQRLNVVAIPKQAVIHQPRTASVFVYKDSLAFYRPIKTGLETGDEVEVISGLEADELLIVEGHTTLRDSAKVKPIMDFIR